MVPGAPERLINAVNVSSVISFVELPGSNTLIQVPMPPIVILLEL